MKNNSTPHLAYTEGSSASMPPSMPCITRLAVETLTVLLQILKIATPKDRVGIDGTYAPLMHAAHIGRLDMCQLLVKYGANPKLSDHGRNNLLDYALSEQGRPSQLIVNLVEFLLVNGAPNPPSLLSKAIRGYPTLKTL
jgi:hypothetical protein